MRGVQVVHPGTKGGLTWIEIINLSGQDLLGGRIYCPWGVSWGQKCWGRAVDRLGFSQKSGRASLPGRTPVTGASPHLRQNA